MAEDNTRNNAVESGLTQYYTLNEVADMTKVKVKTLRSWILDGRLHYTKIGGCVRLTADDIKAVMERR